MIFIFPYIGNVIIPTDFHIFQKGLFRHQPETSRNEFRCDFDTLLKQYVPLMFLWSVVRLMAFDVQRLLETWWVIRPLTGRIELEDTSAMTGNGSVKGKSMFKSIWWSLTSKWFWEKIGMLKKNEFYLVPTEFEVPVVGVGHALLTQFLQCGKMVSGSLHPSTCIYHDNMIID